MTKAYYTEPLAACWMAKHFGMRFDAPIKPVISSYGSPMIQMVPEKFYIHSDSMHLLRPQVGDIVLNCDDDPARVVKGNNMPGHHEVPLAFALEFVGKEAEIIRRNGHAFHWPEWEE